MSPSLNPEECTHIRSKTEPKEPREQDIDQDAAEREQQHVDEMADVSVESEDLCLHHEGGQRERAIVAAVGSVEAGKGSFGPQIR